MLGADINNKEESLGSGLSWGQGISQIKFSCVNTYLTVLVQKFSHPTDVFLLMSLPVK